MNTDEIIEKIKKAIRLANRTTSEGERDTAMRLAKRLADSNGIALEQISADEPSSDKAIMDDDENVVSMRGVEIGYICYILREHFGVIAVMNRLRRSPSHATISWIGSRLNIEIAKHVWHILRREALNSWRNSQKEAKRKLLCFNFDPKVLEVLKKSNAMPKVDKASFMHGFFIAIDQKLKDCPLRNDLDGAKKEASKKLDEFKSNNKVKDQKASSNKSLNAKSLAMGAQAGNKVNLARPCEGVVQDRFAIAQ